ncbi:tetratricopeptide repeat protein [Prevotella nigrescens]|uniref:tetratricopeptide repeat protein n=1 Tax=Prevotella nigrescens TaxID=28133 RepID=UPI0028D14D6F|nr:tetratricopeptide repeat protein [Prevotella nigrescens]
MRKTFLLLVVLCSFSLHAMAQSRRQLIEKGDSCMKAYNYFHAISHYKQAQTLGDDNAIRMKLASCHYLRTAYKQCADMLKTIPEDSLTHDALREMYYAQGAMQQTTLQTYWGMTLIEKFPMDGHIVADLMKVFLNQEDSNPNMAVLYGERYCKVDSDNVEVNRTLGEAYFLNRKYEQCIAIYNKVMAAGDTTYNALYYTAGAYEYLEKFDSAALYFAKAVERDPKMAVGNYRLGVVENQLGRYDAAIEHLRTAATLYEPNKTIMFVIYKNMGDAKNSLKQFKEAYLYWGYALAYADDKELKEKRLELKKRLNL